MIELLLQAERALSYGLVDQAERLYAQAAAADPRNSIAVVGLARVALERGNDAEAYEWARRALTIDPENVAAVRLVARLDEVLANRWMTAPMPAGPGQAAGSVAPGPAAPAAPSPVAQSPVAPSREELESVRTQPEQAELSLPLAISDVADAEADAQAGPQPAQPPAEQPVPLQASPAPPEAPAPESPVPPAGRPEAAARHRSLIDRLLRRNRP